MTTRRQIQIGEEIQQIISTLIQRELKDPRIGFVTITNVDVTRDLKYARVFVSVMGSIDEQKDSMTALQSARGFIRHEVATRMTTRTVPEIHFKLDRGQEYSDRINRLLNEIKDSSTEAPEPEVAAAEVAEPVADASEATDEPSR